MYLLRYSLYVAFAISTISLVIQGQTGFNDGGTTGDNGSHFVNGTANTSKLLPGIFCSKNKSIDEDTLYFYAYMFENDLDFHHEAGPLKGEDVRYENCTLLDTNSSQTMNMRIQSGCALSLVNETGFNISSDLTEHRTWKRVIALNSSMEGVTECGGRVVDGIVVFTVLCSRKHGFSNLFDAAFEMSCNSTNPSQTLVRRIETPGLTVGDPPNTAVSRGYEVDSAVYQQLSKLDIPGPKTVVDDTNVTIPGNNAPLGGKYYYEVCLNITDETRLQFEEIYDVLGLAPHSCEASVDPSLVNAADVPVTTWDITDATGCGLGQSPVRLYGFVFQWLTDSDPTTAKDFLRPPNCVRSTFFEGETPLRKNIGVPLTVTVKCWLHYCTSTELENGVNRCFGNVTTDDETDGYPDCSGIGRRRRQANDNENFVPDGAPATVTVDLTFGPASSDQEQQQDDKQMDCFEKPTFIALTAVLALLLVCVLGVSGFLSCKLSEMNKREDRENSLSGIKNKAYY